MFCTNLIESLTLRSTLSAVAWKLLAKIRFNIRIINRMSLSDIINDAYNRKYAEEGTSKSQLQAVWTTVMKFIEDHLTKGKAVNYPDLGVWTIRREKVGGEDFDHDRDTRCRATLTLSSRRSVALNLS